LSETFRILRRIERGMKQKCILGSVLCTRFSCPIVLKLEYFYNFSKKKLVTENKICVLISSITFVWNISHSTKNWARYETKMYIGLRVMYANFLSDCTEIWIFFLQFFEKKKLVTENKICLLISSITFVWNISHSKKNWARYDTKMYIGLRVMYAIFLSDSTEAWIFFIDYRKKKNTRISNFIKIHQAEAELFYAHERTDRHDDDNSRFSQFCVRA